MGVYGGGEAGGSEDVRGDEGEGLLVVDAAMGLCTRELFISVGVRSAGNTPCSESCSIMICSTHRQHPAIRASENLPGCEPAGEMSMCMYSLTIIF